MRHESGWRETSASEARCVPVANNKSDQALLLYPPAALRLGVLVIEHTVLLLAAGAKAERSRLSWGAVNLRACCLSAKTTNRGSCNKICYTGT